MNIVSVKEILTGIEAKVETEVEDVAYLYHGNTVKYSLTISALCPLGKAIGENLHKLSGMVFMATMPDATIIPVRLIGAKDVYQMPKFYDIRMTLYDLSFEPIENLDFYLGMALQRDWISKYLPKKETPAAIKKSTEVV